MSYSYSDTSTCCSTASAELKLYQAFIFSIPIFFTFILLFLFYLFYLRRRRVDWPSVQQMSATSYLHNNPRLLECGLNKELREMLPIIVFKESFSIRDTQCSVCLGDYQAEDRLQQIPVCSHTFHMDCIDHWLTSHTTCPLCRLSLVPASSDARLSDNQSEPQPQEIHDQFISECPPNNNNNNPQEESSAPAEHSDTECPPNNNNNTQEESSALAEHSDSRINNEELRTEELPV